MIALFSVLGTQKGKDKISKFAKLIFNEGKK